MTDILNSLNGTLCFVLFLIFYVLCTLLFGFLDLFKSIKTTIVVYFMHKATPDKLPSYLFFIKLSIVKSSHLYL